MKTAQPQGTSFAEIEHQIKMVYCDNQWRQILSKNDIYYHSGG